MVTKYKTHACVFVSVISAGSFTSERLSIVVVCCGQKKYLNWEGHPRILVLNGETPNWKGSSKKEGGR